MPAFDSAQPSASTGTDSNRVLLDALVVVAAKRLVLGADMAAANMPSVRRGHIDALFDRRLRTGTALRQLGELRRDTADVALRSLRTICPPAVAADPHGHGPVPRPSTTPAYYQGRPAGLLLSAFRSSFAHSGG
jgi:hypothetical protein